MTKTRIIFHQEEPIISDSGTSQQEVEINADVIDLHIGGDKITLKQNTDLSKKTVFITVMINDRLVTGFRVR